MRPTTRAEANPLPPGPGMPDTGEPDFLARARRILTGNIRHDDHLPETPEVRMAVARGLAFARQRLPGEPSSEVASQQTRRALLAAHFAGQNIAYVSTDRGVAVLAVGLEQVRAVLDGVPPAGREQLVVTCPETDS